MTLASILKNKRENKDKLLKIYNLTDSKKALWILVLSNNLINQVLFDALKILPANFIVISKEELTSDKNISISSSILQDSWLDFIVCDECEDNLMKYLKLWVVPIVYKEHHITNLLSEFNAAKVEWNSFIFENNTLCDVYYAIIRYLENYKFSYDNKALVKNILDI